jgi:hypothetical protein
MAAASGKVGDRQKAIGHRQKAVNTHSVIASEATASAVALAKEEAIQFFYKDRLDCHGIRLRQGFGVMPRNDGALIDSSQKRQTPAKWLGFVN